MSTVEPTVTRIRQDEELAPLQQRVEMIDAQLAEQDSQLERLLDLFLSGEFPKEMLTDRKTRLETTIASLEKERVSLVTRLEAESLTQNQIQGLMSFAATVTENLKSIDSFDTRRQIIEELDVWTTLSVENALKVAYIRCYLGESSVCILSRATNRGDAQKER